MPSDGIPALNLKLNLLIYIAQYMPISKKKGALLFRIGTPSSFEEVLSIGSLEPDKIGELVDYRHYSIIIPKTVARVCFKRTAVGLYSDDASLHLCKRKSFFAALRENFLAPPRPRWFFEEGNSYLRDKVFLH